LLKFGRSLLVGILNIILIFHISNQEPCNHCRPNFDGLIQWLIWSESSSECIVLCCFLISLMCKFMKELKAIVPCLSFLQSLIECDSDVHTIPCDGIVYRGLRSGRVKLIPLYYSMIGEWLFGPVSQTHLSNESQWLISSLQVRMACLWDLTSSWRWTTHFWDHSVVTSESVILIAASSVFMVDQLLERTKFMMQNKENSVTLINSEFSDGWMVLRHEDDWMVEIHWSEAFSCQSPIWNGQWSDWVDFFDRFGWIFVANDLLITIQIDAYIFHRIRDADRLTDAASYFTHSVPVINEWEGFWDASKYESSPQYLKSYRQASESVISIRFARETITWAARGPTNCRILWYCARGWVMISSTFWSW
jgi:hypothetical protein